jgi:hypothetical protein
LGEREEGVAPTETKYITGARWRHRGCWELDSKFSLEAYEPSMWKYLTQSRIMEPKEGLT